MYNNKHEIAKTSENISLLGSATIVPHTGKDSNALTLEVQTIIMYVRTFISMCICV